MKALTLGSIALALALAVASCTPHVGGSCSGNVGTCTNGHEALWCVGGHFAQLSCRGATGCATVGSQVRCDQGIAVEHDRCLPGASGQAACSPDHANALRCNGTEMALLTDCEGPNHCSSRPIAANPGATEILCDESVVSAGDPCQGTDDACSVDHGAMMSCVDQHWRVFAACGGANHCTIADGRVHCDESIAAPGAACGDDNRAACSPDGVSFELCRNHVMVTGGACTGEQHCHIVGTEVMCSGTITSSVGSPCSQGTACTADGAHLLRCEGGSFVQGDACRAGRSCLNSGNPATCVRPGA